jgi:16S rRNA (cytidine1402-2'-O)-methyltransferase
VRGEGVRVVPIPGPSSVTAALSASPLPIERFLFEGFLPSRPIARRKRLRELASSSVAVVFFEAARRLRETLDDFVGIVDSGRQILLAKELTKLHERIEHGGVAELLVRLDDGEFFEYGEFVCVLAPSSEEAGLQDAEVAALMDALCDELSPAQAARIAAKFTRRPRSELYDYAVKYQRDR